MKPRKKPKVSHGATSKEQKRSEKEEASSISKANTAFDDIEEFSETENLDEVIADDDEEGQEGAIPHNFAILNDTQMNLLLTMPKTPRKVNKMISKTLNQKVHFFYI
jgi:hypothetical protein